MDVALARRDQYGDLASCFAGRLISQARSEPKPVAAPAGATSPGAGAPSNVGDSPRSESTRDAEQAAIVAYEDEQAVRAGVDHLQIALGEKWRVSVQGAALWIAGAYGIGLTHAARLPNHAEPRYVLAGLLLGGPIAWIIRDATALLERARR